MKLTPSSTARRSAAIACSLSGGSPQISLPVMRIAPNPRRLAASSPPIRIVPAADADDWAFMCFLSWHRASALRLHRWSPDRGGARRASPDWVCLLYTSDAADDLLCVDLGGR